MCAFQRVNRSVIILIGIPSNKRVIIKTRTKKKLFPKKFLLDKKLTYTKTIFFESIFLIKIEANI